MDYVVQQRPVFSGTLWSHKLNFLTIASWVYNLQLVKTLGRTTKSVVYVTAL